MKKLRVTVAGKVYEVIVEILEDDEHALPHPVKHDVPSVHEVTGALTPPVVAPVSKEPGNVISPLAGRVVTISVQTGQTVKEGDQLLVLEAMKMNNYIYAPRSGRVSAIFVKADDAVEEGQTLLTLA